MYQTNDTQEKHVKNAKKKKSNSRSLLRSIILYSSPEEFTEIW
jgi:hypothetical protein